MHPDRRSTGGSACLLTALLPAVLAWPLHVSAQVLPPQVQQLPQPVQPQLHARQTLLDGMNPDQRRDLDRRLTLWDARSQADRQQIRARWQAWQALPTDERAEIAAAARAFAVLPVVDQQALRQRFDAQEPLQQRGWLLGPLLGRDFIRLAPLLLQVSESQREPLLQVLRQLTPQQRADLAVLAQRIPPEQREQLRSELLATPTVGRTTWLHGWLDR